MIKIINVNNDRIFYINKNEISCISYNEESWSSVYFIHMSSGQDISVTKDMFESIKLILGIV